MRRTICPNSIAQVATLLFATGASAQVPFSLDTTFRTVIESQYVNSLLPLEEGKILLSGRIRFPGDMNFRAGARLDSDGARDVSFPDVVYMGGKLTKWNDRVYAANGPGLRRCWYSGLLDASFNMVNAPYFSALQGGDYHVFPDGRVLMSGAHTLSDTERGFVGLYQLIWFTNTGYLDTTRIHRKGNGTVFRFKELPDGKFICAGFCTQFDGHDVDRIFRVHADGAVDTTFRTGVIWGGARGYLPLPDGRVYACGNFGRAQAPDDTLLVARFHPDGTLDMTFNAPHLSLGAIPNNVGALSVQSIRPWGADRIMVLGQFQFADGEPRRGICVLDTTGALTDMFDDCGVGLFTYEGNTNAVIGGFLPDADSTHYYIWGAYNGYDDGTTNDTLQRFVTRLHVGDITTGTSGVAKEPRFALYPNPTSGGVTMQLQQVPANAQLVLRDALGREVLRQRVRDHYTTVTIDGTGVYMVELHDASGRVAITRVVVE